MTNPQPPSQYHISTSENILHCKHLYRIPPRLGRYIVLDTETTGLNHDDHVVELGAHEIINGKLSGGQFHIYIRPRIKMCDEVIKIHGITNDFYDEYYKDIYENDKQNLLNFVKWVGNSLIFAHNASFDLNAINIELKNFEIPEFPVKRFRCSMKMFKDVVGRINPEFYDKYVCLEKCCEYFKLKATNNYYHNALFDAFMTARMVCKVYEMIENDTRFRNIKREIKYNPNCYKSYNPNINSLLIKKNMEKSTKIFLGQKTNHDKEENFLIDKEINDFHKIKNINENISNSNTDSASTGNLDESLEKKENELEEDIIDEIFSEL